MTPEDMHIVRDAAAYLDKYHKYSDWRTRIDIDTLRMSSVHLCVIGQSYGDYYDGKRNLRENSSDSEFDKHIDAWCGLTNEWKEYLQTCKSEFTDLAGIWYSNDNRKFLILSVYEDFGKKHVVYRANDGAIAYTKTEASFRSDFTRNPKPEYVPGRLYKGINKDGNNASVILMFNTTAHYDGPGFYRLDIGTHGDTESMVARYGPLSEVKIMTIGRNVHGVINS